MTVKRRSRTSSKAGLNRKELATALQVSTRAVDRLIAGGLPSVGTRGKARLYSLAAARAARRALGMTPSSTSSYAETLIALLHAQTIAALDQEHALQATFVSDTEWRSGWEEERVRLEAELSTWPARLACQAAGVNARDAVRPLLQGLADREPGPRFMALIGGPLPPEPPPKATTIPDAKAALIAARTAVQTLRTTIRRGHFRRRADVLWAIEDAVTASRTLWWSVFPARVAQSTAAGDCEIAASETLADVLARLDPQAFRWP